MADKHYFKPPADEPEFDKNTWSTPRPIFNTINQLHPMVLDTAADALNTMLPAFITEQMDSLVTPWRLFAPRGTYCWNNPPYSHVAPWPIKATLEQRQQLGTIMLVFNDTSAGWYAYALQHACEVWHVVQGRISFINPVTGKRVPGNNRPSVFFIWHPVSRRRGSIITRYVTRDSLLSGDDLKFIL